MFSAKGPRAAFVAVFALMMLAQPRSALAWSDCGSSYVVQSGDTLGSVAAKCGTTVDDLAQANPDVGYVLYSGQTLIIPGPPSDAGGYGGCQSYNCGSYQGPSYCYGFPSAPSCAGYQDAPPYYGGPYGGCFGGPCGAIAYTQYFPPGAGTYVVRPGDTMRIIADRLRIPLGDLISANPQIWNPGLIYVGQIICLPSYPVHQSFYRPGFDRGCEDHPCDHRQSTSNQYVVQPGEKLKDIARKFDTTQDDLLKLNPSLLGKPGRIYVGMVLLIR